MKDEHATRIETEEVLLDLAAYVGDPDGIGGLAVLECQWCHAAFTLDSGLNLESHETDCRFRKVAEAALRNVGKRTEVWYVSADDGEGLMRGAPMSIVMRDTWIHHDDMPVTLSWDAPETGASDG